MSVVSRSRRGAVAAAQVRGLMTTCFATIVILLIEYGLGMYVNFYTRLPRADIGSGTATAFGRALTNGPAGLTIHVIVGIILLASALTAIWRASTVRSSALVGVTFLGLVAVIVAGIAGSNFVNDPSAGSSMLMAIMAGVAILIYALTMFLAAVRRV
ncbi:MAG TPA: hypothetical protein VH478_11270 [Trebonia sp.]|jgi:hypothetical protein|nr:hypothetical protein [Trebonia sp.]